MNILKKSLLAFAAVVVLLALGGQAHASTYISSNDPDTVVTSVKDAKPVYAGGNRLSFNTEIMGDLFAAGQNIFVNQAVLGSVYAAGADIELSGPITHSARLAGGDTVTVKSKIAEDLSVAATNLTITTESVIGGDVHLAGPKIIIDGHVMGDVYAAGTDVQINGTIDGNVHARANKITVSDTALIKGNLTYTSPNTATIASGVIKGKIDYTQQVTKKFMGTFTFDVIGMILIPFIIGLFLIWLFRYALEKIITMESKKFGQFAWLGLLFLILTPIIAFIFAITLIGLPVSFIIFFLYALTVYITKIVAALAVGSYLYKYVSKSKTFIHPVAGLLLGLVVLAVVVLIPIIGWLVIAIIRLITLGAIVFYVKSNWLRMRTNKEI